jgi:hypothetical protein
MPATLLVESLCKCREKLHAHAAAEQKAVTEAKYLSQQGVVVLTGTSAISPFGNTDDEKNRIPLFGLYLRWIDTVRGTDS